MSISPRVFLAWLLSAALMAAYCPATLLAADGHGRGGHGGGGRAGVHAGSGVHGGSSFRGGAAPGKNFSGQAKFHSGNVGHSWKGTPHIATRPGISGGIHTGTIAGHSGHWNAGKAGVHRNWNYHASPVWRHPNFVWNDWWRYGYAHPWVGIGSWPRYYDYGYSYPYYGNNYYDYGYDVAPYTVYSPESVQTEAPIETETPIEPEMPMQAGSEIGDFHSQALEAFQQGQFRDAVRLASHAAIDDPKNQEVHLLMSLALFAVGQYRGAAMEAHAVAALGPMPDWPKVAELYNNKAEPYTTQLRALEKFVRDNRTSPEGRFLLGFQYVIAGHRDVAQGQLLQALKLAPRDNLAAQLLTKAGGTIPADIAQKLESARRQPSTSDTESGATK